MRHTLLLRLVLLCAVLLVLVACGRGAPAPTPEPAAPEPTAEAVAVATLPAPTPEPTVAPVEQVSPPAAVSQAELAKLRKPAIDAVLANMELPEEGDLVARVNGAGISVQEYREFLRLRLDSLAGQHEIGWDDAESSVLLREVEAQILEQLIDMELMRQEAEAQGIHLDEAEVAGFIRDVQGSLIEGLGYASWEEYKETLELSDQAFERIIRQSLLLDQMMERQVIDLEVEQVHARHILVTEQELAEEILKRLAAGDDFGGLAATYSEDHSSAQQGGDLGWFPRGVMVRQFEEAAFALEPGETSAIIASDFGLHIIQVLDKGVRPLDPYYAAQFRQMAFIEWLQELRERAEIERFVLQPAG